MLRDRGSRDRDFIDLIARAAGAPGRAGRRRGRLMSAVPLQGSGTFVVEAMLGTRVPRDGKLLVWRRRLWRAHGQDGGCHRGVPVRR